MPGRQPRARLYRIGVAFDESRQLVGERRCPKPSTMPSTANSAISRAPDGIAPGCRAPGRQRPSSQAPIAMASAGSRRTVNPTCAGTRRATQPRPIRQRDRAEPPAPGVRRAGAPPPRSARAGPTGSRRRSARRSSRRSSSRPAAEPSAHGSSRGDDGLPSSSRARRRGQPGYGGEIVELVGEQADEARGGERRDQRRDPRPTGCSAADRPDQRRAEATGDRDRAERHDQPNSARRRREPELRCRQRARPGRRRHRDRAQAATATGSPSARGRRRQRGAARGPDLRGRHPRLRRQPHRHQRDRGDQAGARAGGPTRSRRGERGQRAEQRQRRRRRHGIAEGVAAGAPRGWSACGRRRHGTPRRHPSWAAPRRRSPRGLAGGRWRRFPGPIADASGSTAGPSSRGRASAAASRPHSERDGPAPEPARAG